MLFTPIHWIWRSHDASAAFADATQRTLETAAPPQLCVSAHLHEQTITTAMAEMLRKASCG